MATLLDSTEVQIREWTVIHDHIIFRGAAGGGYGEEFSHCPAAPPEYLSSAGCLGAYVRRLRHRGLGALKCHWTNVVSCTLPTPTCGCHRQSSLLLWVVKLTDSGKVQIWKGAKPPWKRSDELSRKPQASLARSCGGLKGVWNGRVEICDPAPPAVSSLCDPE